MGSLETSKLLRILKGKVPQESVDYKRFKMGISEERHEAYKYLFIDSDIMVNMLVKDGAAIFYCRNVARGKKAEWNYIKYINTDNYEYSLHPH